MMINAVLTRASSGITALMGKKGGGGQGGVKGGEGGGGKRGGSSGKNKVGGRGGGGKGGAGKGKGTGNPAQQARQQDAPRRRRTTIPSAEGVELVWRRTSGSADLHAWRNAAELMDAGLEKAAAFWLKEAGWERLQESSDLAALASSLRMPFRAAQSLQRQVLTKKAIKRSHTFVRKERELLEAVRRDDVLRASAEFDLPPLQVFGFLLEHTSDWCGEEATTVAEALNHPDVHLSGEYLNMYRDARHADSVTQTSDQKRKAHRPSASFKRYVEARLEAAGVAFITEDAQRRAQPEGTQSIPPTPDFLIPPDFSLVAGDAEVRWIKVNNFFGSALGYRRKSMTSKFEKYRRLYGPGAVVFKQGAGESVLSVLPPDVIVLALPPEP